MACRIRCTVPPDPPPIPPAAPPSGLPSARLAAARIAPDRPGIGLLDMAGVVALLGLAAWLVVAVLAPARSIGREAAAAARLDHAAQALAARVRQTGALPCPDATGTGWPDPVTPGEAGFPCAVAAGALPWAVLGARAPMGSAGLAGSAGSGGDLVYLPSPEAVRPGALACPDPAAPPDPTTDSLAVAFGLGDGVGLDPAASLAPRPMAFALVLPGAPAGPTPDPESAEARNRALLAAARQGPDLPGPLYAAPLPGDPDPAAFDDRVFATSRSVLLLRAGCPPWTAAAAPGPLTIDLPTSRAALADPTQGLDPSSWTPRGLGGSVLDSGQTRLTLNGGEPVTVMAEGGSLTVAADPTGGLGLWSPTAPLTDRWGGVTSGGDLGIDGHGTADVLTILLPGPAHRLTLALGHFDGRASLPAFWRATHDAAAFPCLAPPDAGGTCPVVLIERARLSAWRGDVAVGAVEIWACPGRSGSPSVPVTLGFDGAAFDRLDLKPLTAVSAAGDPVDSEGSFFTLEALTTAPCPDPDQCAAGSTPRLACAEAD